MGRYLHLFETEGEFSPARGNDYIEPWVSLTVKGTGDVKSFIGEFENGLEQQFNYFGSYGDDYVNADIIESDITAIDGENQTVTVDGYVFNFRNSRDGKCFYTYQGESQTTGTVERTWIEEIQFGEQTQQISACTVNGATFGMAESGDGQYFWLEVDFTTMSIGTKNFTVDHELQVNESVTMTEQLRLNGYTSIEPVVGGLFKYINFTNSTMQFISENGRRVQVGDTYRNITVKSIVETEEGETLNRVNYNKTEYEKQLEKPLTFDVQSDGNVVVSSQNYNLEYKKNDGEWIVTNPDSESEESGLEVEIPVVSGDTVQFRGNNSNGIGNSIFINTTCQFAVEGNIMSLLNNEHFSTLTSVPSSCFENLFANCTGLTDASKLLLPATILADSCYHAMFNGCTSLTIAPALPATTLANYCYYMMFRRCTSLSTAPELPATTLANYCYNSMFEGCTGLTTAPALPATTLTKECYCDMFYGCTSLTQAPELPATTLAQNCYYMMFQNCTGLTKAPVLPATTLAQNCYYYMFNGCTSLVAAPVLPATTLAQNCYRGMFRGCTSLTTVPALPATTLAQYCYNGMFNGCTSLVTAPVLPATTLANSCYQGMFEGCASLTTAPSILPATTLAERCYQSMFSGCTSLTTAPSSIGTSATISNNNGSVCLH